MAEDEESAEAALRTQEIKGAKARAWLEIEAHARAADAAWKVYAWAIEVYPQIQDLAAGEEIGFVTARPGADGEIAFEHSTKGARRIYGRQVDGATLISVIPPELHEAHLAGLARAAGDYLTEEELVVHEHEIVRLDGSRQRCRFVVKKFPGPVARYIQFIWRVPRA